MIGLSLALLPGNSLQDTIAAFLALQENFSLEAVEIHLEKTLYPSACRPWDMEDGQAIRTQVRPNVTTLGIHLPFMDLNPVSADNRIAEFSSGIMRESIQFASSIAADYVVFHARGGVLSDGVMENRWREVICSLADTAKDYRIMFCLENADDLRDPATIARIGEAREHVHICLDIGHLYERVYPASPLMRKVLVYNDHFSPIPFTISRELPAGRGWCEVFEDLRNTISLIHIHNHNGKTAHRPLTHGKIDLHPILGMIQKHQHIPVILEADYREAGSRALLEDLEWITEQV